MLKAALALFVGSAAASKTCIAEWSADVMDQCALYSELTNCQTKLGMCTAVDVVHMLDIDGGIHAVALDDNSFSGLSAKAVAIAGEDAITINYAYSYASMDVDVAVTDDASLKKALSVGRDGVFKLAYVVSDPDGWVDRGVLHDWEAVYGAYPPSHYVYGVTYNTGGFGQPHKVVPSSWNRGTRLTSGIYMQKDDAKLLEMGCAVFFKGTNDATDWEHAYYQMIDGEYTQYSSQNSVAGGNSPRLFTRKLPNPWEHVGTLADFETIVGNHDSKKYQFGIKYNHSMGYVHDIVISGWNRGVRLTTEQYMMGDTGTTLDMGRTVFAKGLDGQDATPWEHRYYKFADGSWNSFHTNGESSGTNLYARLM